MSCILRNKLIKRRIFFWYRHRSFNAISCWDTEQDNWSFGVVSSKEHLVTHHLINSDVHYLFHQGFQHFGAAHWVKQSKLNYSIWVAAFTELELFNWHGNVCILTRHHSFVVDIFAYKLQFSLWPPGHHPHSERRKPPPAAPTREPHSCP